MIPSSAALPVVFGERPQVQQLGQRRVADQEPPSERRSEGQPGYLAESLLHLHHHRARITGIQPTLTDISPTGILPTVIPPTVIQAMDTQPIHSPAMNIQATQVLRGTPLHRSMDTRADLGSRITPFPPVTDTPATRNIPLTSARRATNTQPMKGTPLTQAHRAIDHRAIWDPPVTLVSSPTAIRTARFILPTRVPVMDLPRMDTPPIALPRTGRLGLGMAWSPLAEFVLSKPLPPLGAK